MKIAYVATGLTCLRKQRHSGGQLASGKSGVGFFVKIYFLASYLGREDVYIAAGSVSRAGKRSRFAEK
jgi:hypothetical protein